VYGCVCVRIREDKIVNVLCRIYPPGSGTPLCGCILGLFIVLYGMVGGICVLILWEER